MGLATLLGVFQELRKATVRSSCPSIWLYVCLSVCLSVRMEQIGSNWKNFHEILYVSIFKNKSVQKIQVPLKSDKNNGYFSWKHFYIYDSITLSYS